MNTQSAHYELERVNKKEEFNFSLKNEITYLDLRKELLKLKYEKFGLYYGIY